MLISSSISINIGNILIRDEFIYVLCSEASQFSIKILNTKGKEKEKEFIINR